MAWMPHKTGFGGNVFRVPVCTSKAGGACHGSQFLRFTGVLCDVKVQICPSGSKIP